MRDLKGKSVSSGAPGSGQYQLLTDLLRVHGMNRNDVTEMIIAAKIKKGLKWEDVAKKIGLSKEWVTAGCLGQMTFDKKQATTLGKIFGLPPDAEGVSEGFATLESLRRLAPTMPVIVSSGQDQREGGESTPKVERRSRPS